MDSQTVNNFFKRDINALLGYDLWRMPKTIEFFSLSTEYTYIISPSYYDDLKTYRLNLMYVLDTYFTWNEKEFPNPLDQYIWIEANMAEVIIPRLLEGFGKEEEIMHRDLKNLMITVRLWFTKLGNYIYLIGAKHKFQEDDRDEDIEAF